MVPHTPTDPTVRSGRGSRGRAVLALALAAALTASLVASVARAQEGAETTDLSPLAPPSCTYALASWQADTVPWPAEQLFLAGTPYTRAELSPLLATVDDGTLRADVALAQQLIVYKLNLLRGAMPTTDAIDAALEAETLLGGLPTGDEEIGVDALERMASLRTTLEASNTADACPDPSEG